MVVTGNGLLQPTLFLEDDTKIVVNLGLLGPEL